MSKEQRINLNIVIFLIITSITIGFFGIRFFSNPVGGDSLYYDKLATALLTDHSFIVIDDYWVAPGYPFFLAVIYKITGHSHILAYLAQYILLGITASLIFSVGIRFFGLSWKAAVLPALLMIFWPYAVYYSAQMLTEILYMTLLLVFAYLFLSDQNNANARYAIFAGISLGFAALTRPLPLLMPFWIFFILLAVNYFADKKNSAPAKPFNLKKLFLIFVIFYLAISPWIIYSSLKLKKIVPITAPIQNTQKENDEYFYEWTFYQTPGYEPGAETTLKKTAIMRIKNFFRFWRSGLNGTWFDNIANKYPYFANFTILYRIFYYLIVIFFFYSIKFYYKDKNYFFLLQIILYTWILHTALHTQPRFALPVMPIVILFSCLGAYAFINQIKNGIRSRQATS